MMILKGHELPDSLKVWKYGDNTLWLDGDQHLLKHPTASVIGSRDVTEDGKARTQRVTKLLVKYGIVVVSGLAKGVDTIAHRTALDNNGATIAVMGTPIDRCYPAENRPLKEEIRKRGLVISQFPPGTPVFPSNFPKRNSLMAALSDITIVVEAGESSGTRHQVRFALQVKKRVAILASLAEKNFPWIKEALKSGYGFLIAEPDDLVSLIKNKVGGSMLVEGQMGLPIIYDNEVRQTLNYLVWRGYNALGN